MTQFTDRDSRQNDAQLAFLANIGHELKTPMNSILGFIQLVLKDARLPDELREYLEQANISADKLLHIIEALLDLSKLQVGKIQLDARPFDINYLMDTVKNSFADAVHPGVTLQVIKNNYNRYFYGDPLRLELIVSEVVNNAVKFTESGAITLYLKNEKPQAGADSLNMTIQISDTGIGVKKEYHRLIFEPFAQVDGSSTRKHGGIGSGLAIVSESVKLMGGSITFSSEYSKGTDVILTLPLTPAKAEEVNTHKKVFGYVKETIRPIYSILVVDDVDMNLNLAKANLERFGHRPLLAGSGIEAIEICEKEIPDIIFMDLHMPLMNGYEAIKHIRDIARDHDKKPVIVAMTASIITDKSDKITDAHFDAVVSKPINFSKLMARLESLLEDRFSTPAMVPAGKMSGKTGSARQYREYRCEELQKIIEKQFDSYNPDDIIPYIDALSCKDSTYDFAHIKKALNVYDFDRAYELFTQYVADYSTKE
ncbi:MAG: ATP-binding response regulator [Fibrobacterota bacterium]